MIPKPYYEERNLIVKMIFGSHLYGTNTPRSDMDYKGVFMPTAEEILLGKIPRSINSSTKKRGDDKNSAEDVDTEFYSLHYFISLACEGETAALDMLHAPANMLIESSPIWDEIVANREKFYTKNLKAFIGYARRQASKYGIKGSRLNDAKTVLDFLMSKNQSLRLSNIWAELPTGEHIFKQPPNVNGERMYEVCGRKINESAHVSYSLDIVKRFHDAYGERAKQAADNKGIDWKAVSHALRAAYQVRQILTEGTITFPLKEAGFLILVKNGAYGYLDEVAPELEALMNEVENLAEKSTLPEKADRKYWERFIIKHARQEVLPLTQPQPKQEQESLL